MHVERYETVQERMRGILTPILCWESSLTLSIVHKLQRWCRIAEIMRCKRFETHNTSEGICEWWIQFPSPHIDCTICWKQFWHAKCFQLFSTSCRKCNVVWCLLSASFALQQRNLSCMVEKLMRYTFGNRKTHATTTTTTTTTTTHTYMLWRYVLD